MFKMWGITSTKDGYCGTLGGEHGAKMVGMAWAAGGGLMVVD